MTKKFIVQIGSADSDSILIQTVPATEKLVEAADVYVAHKKAYIDCNPGQEVLAIKSQVGTVLYTLKDGFIKA